ncbi:histidine kinase [Pontibacter mangrovi]|uniref:Histidine kinase n=1 Tax=Pontibacter mangrovi TaxID=2589816 RepID=A0A501W7M0_9BACT|nr:histidine kinase [Pontibacter mangrovi]TPE45308.1 histidine kinase [Pontibacter mangrovi]
MELARLDFQQLRVKHIFCKSKVRTVLYGAGDDSSFFQSQNPVSLWFTSVGQVKYGKEPEMQHLHRLHRDFSVLSDELIKKYKSGQIEQAHAGLAELGEMSDKFLKIVSSLEMRYQ